MESVQIESIRECALPDVAEFIQAFVDRDAGREVQASEPLYRTLEHRLVRRPTQMGDGTLGHCLRTAAGKIAGVNLISVNKFVQQDRVLLGLVSGNFFVAADARMQGFLLFRKFLAVTGVDFWYATSSNQNSGPLWRQLGGGPVPGSDRELIWPLEFGVLAEELARRRQWPRVVASLSRAAGLFSRILRPRPSGMRLTVTRSRDWDKLGSLAARCRDRATVTAERSAAQLEWLYADAGHEIYELKHETAEGWFAVSFGRRGTNQQVRIATLFDLVWPSGARSLGSLARSMVDVCRGRADAIVFEGTIVPALEAALPFLRKNSHGFDRAFVRVKGPGGPALAQSIVLMPSDGA